MAWGSNWGGGGQGRDGGGGGGRGRGGFRSGGRGGFGSRGGWQRDEGPPASVIDIGKFLHPCEGEMVYEMTAIAQVPKFNAPVYLENKTVIGKIEEVLGPISQVHFSVKPSEGVLANAFKPGDKIYMAPDKLLPLQRFTQPQSGGGGGRGGIAKRGRGGGRGRGGRGGGRGARGGRGGRGGGGGGFRGRGGGGRGGSRSFGGRGGAGGGFGGGGGFRSGGSGGRGGFGRSGGWR